MAGICLPGAFGQAIAEWEAACVAGTGWAPVEADRLHLPLALIGPREGGRRRIPASAIRRVRAAAPRLKLDAEVRHESSDRASLRLVRAEAAGLGPLIAELKRQLGEGWRAAGVGGSQSLCMILSRSERGERPDPSGPAQLPESLRRIVLGVRLTLYRSETRPTGLQCDPLAQVELPSR